MIGKSWFLGGGVSSGPSGRAVLNGFLSVYDGDFPYKNLALGISAINNTSTNTDAFPGLLNDNGYPVGVVANNLSLGQMPIPLDWTGDFIIGWTGTPGGGILLNNNGSIPRYVVTSDTGTTAPNVVGSADNYILLQGTSGRVKFNFGANPSEGNIPVYLLAGTYDGTFSGLYICRDNAIDEADILSGDLSRMFNNDFVAKIAFLNPYAIRVMDLCNINNSNVTQPYTHRHPVTALTFGATNTVGKGGARFPNSCWVSGGAISGTTDTFTCSAAPGTPGTWTHGEVFQGQFGASAANTIYAFTAVASGTGGRIKLTMASTTGLTTGQPIAFFQGYNGGEGRGNYTITVDDSTHITLTTNIKTGQPSVVGTTGAITGSFTTATINCGSRGVKLLTWGARGGGFQLTSLPDDVIFPNSIGTFTYDQDYDAVLFTPGLVRGTEQIASGLVCGPPIEVIVALANKLNKALYYCFPGNVTDSDVTATVAYVKANLRSTLSAYFEYLNECWNTGFAGTITADNKGANLGFPASSNRARFGYYGLRVRQIMALVTTAWGGADSRLHTVVACQGFGGAGVGQPNSLYRLQSTDLTPSGNAIYAASSISGGVDYTAIGQRTADVCTDLSYATYYSAAQMGPTGQDTISNTYLTNTLEAISDAGQLLWQADKYVNGNPTEQAAALAWLDDNIRKGTVAPLTVTSVTGGTTFNYASTTMFGYPKPIYDAGTCFLSSTGTMPTGITTTTPLYMKSPSATNMQLSLTPGGSAITPTGYTGTLSINAFGSANETLYNLDIGDTGSGTPYGVYPAWNTLAASFTSARAGFGAAPLKITCYEGGFQSFVPTAAVLAAMGDASSTTNSSNIAALLLAYKLSAPFKQLVKDQLGQMMGTYASSPNFGLLTLSSHASWYTFGGGSQWSLKRPSAAGNFTSYTGFAEYNA